MSHAQKVIHRRDSFITPPTLITWWSSRLNVLTFFGTNEKSVPLVPVRDIFVSLETSCVVWFLDHGGRHLHDSRLPRVVEAHVGTVIRDTQEASVLCEVVQIPLFLG